MEVNLCRIEGVLVNAFGRKPQESPGIVPFPLFDPVCPAQSPRAKGFGRHQKLATDVLVRVLVRWRPKARFVCTSVFPHTMNTKASPRGAVASWLEEYRNDIER